MNKKVFFGAVIACFLIFFAVFAYGNSVNKENITNNGDNMWNMPYNISNPLNDVPNNLNVSEENVSEVVYDSYYGYGNNKYTVKDEGVYDSNGELVCTILNESNDGRYVSINGSIYYESGGAGVYVGNESDLK